jgi:hypothetical protein
LLHCGIDASARDGGIFAVAAVTYGLEAAKKANNKWSAALKGRTFHMTDLNARQGEFKGLGDDEVADIMKATVGIVARYAYSVVAVACDAREVAGYLPTVARHDAASQEVLAAMQSTYGLMCNLCMTGVGERCRGNRDVAYTLESGDDGQRGVLRYLDFVESHQDSEGFRDAYSFRNKKVGTKAEIEGIFHAADLVAWECGKRAEQHLRGQTIKRKSFDLIRAGSNRYFAYFPPENMKHLLQAFREVLGANRPEEVVETVRRWLEIREAAEADSPLFPVPL